MDMSASTSKQTGSSSPNSAHPTENESLRQTRDDKETSQPEEPVASAVVRRGKKPTQATAIPIYGLEKPQEEVLSEKQHEIIVDESRHTADESTTGDAQAGETSNKIVYPSGVQLGVLTFGLCLATFVVALDNTIIATAIPKITTQFNSLGDVGWYGSSYLLTTTALQPSFGRIYTYFNVKWTYIFALCLFEVGSVVCATAPSSVALIVGRAVAGAGASALFSGAMTIIGFSVTLRRRPMYIGAISSMFGISSVVGPLLGGAFTDRVTWR